MSQKRIELKNFRYNLSKITHDLKNIFFQFKFRDFVVYEWHPGAIFFATKSISNDLSFYSRAGNKIRVKIEKRYLGIFSALPPDTLIICKKHNLDGKIILIDAIFYDGKDLTAKNYEERMKSALFDGKLQKLSQLPITSARHLNDQQSYIFRKKDDIVCYSTSAGPESLSGDIKYLPNDDLEDGILSEYYVNKLKGGVDDVIFIAYQYRRNRKIQLGKTRIKDKRNRDVAMSLIDSNKRAVCELRKNGKRNVNYDFVNFKSGKPFASVIEKRKRIKVFFKSISKMPGQ